MIAMINWPLNPYPVSGLVSSAVHAGREALHHAYLAGFKDGLLLAVAIFSILLVLFRKD